MRPPPPLSRRPRGGRSRGCSRSSGPWRREPTAGAATRRPSPDTRAVVRGPSARGAGSPSSARATSPLVSSRATCGGAGQVRHGSYPSESSLAASSAPPARRSCRPRARARRQVRADPGFVCSGSRRAPLTRAGCARGRHAHRSRRPRASRCRAPSPSRRGSRPRD